MTPNPNILSRQPRSGELRSSGQGRSHISLGWYLLAAYVVAAIFVVAQVSGWQGRAYWAAPLIAGVQAGGAAASQSLRLRRDQWLTPGNFALAMWFLQLVILPVLLVMIEPPLRPLRALQPTGAINTAMCVEALAYAAFAACFARRAGKTRTVEPLRTALWPVPTHLVVACLVIGAIGMVLLFPSPHDALAYYAGHPQLIQPGVSTSMTEGASALMRPFLGIGCLLWLQRCLATSPSRRRLLDWRILVAAAVIFLSYSGYHYNRSTFTTACICLIASLSLKVRRIGLPVLLTVIVIGTVAAIQVGTYRLIYFGTRGGEILAQEAGLQNYRPDPLGQLQVYMGAPQFVAIPVRATNNGTSPIGPAPIIASALSPIPILGKPFRSESTTSIYNESIYGTSRVEDQHPPLIVELLWTLGLIGVVAGFAILGWFIAVIDDRFMLAHDIFESYVHAFLGVSLAFFIAGGIAVLAQTSIYFCLPMYLLLAITRAAYQKAFSERRSVVCG
jgi:hypothetical protein